MDGAIGSYRPHGQRPPTPGGEPTTTGCWLAAAEWKEKGTVGVLMERPAGNRGESPLLVTVGPAN